MLKLSRHALFAMLALPVLAQTGTQNGQWRREINLGGAVTGGPMTYSINGRQFIVVAVGGREGHEFVALSIPPPGVPAPAKAKPAGNE